MRSTLKRLLISCVAVAALFTFMPLSASAADGFYDHNGGYHAFAFVDGYGHNVYADNHGRYFWVDNHNSWNYVPRHVVPTHYGHAPPVHYSAHNPGLFGLIFGH